ncbi:MAG: hypothetical protein LDLANPLL_02769 [Turneriella sp.]|nr:hypothetical protein [Turneriella sp.]
MRKHVTNFWRRIAPIISPGLRVKLTIFTLFFVSVLLLAGFFFSYISLKGQLEDSFRKEVRAPEEVISSHVSDLQRFTQGLVQLETFRIRLKEKTQAAQKFRKAVVVKEDSFANKARSFFKKFGARVQYSYQTQRFETYYSKYLTDRNLKDFEAQLKSAIDSALPRPVEASVFARWKTLAARVASQEVQAAHLEERAEVNDKIILSKKNAAAKNRSILMNDLSRVFDTYLQAKLDRMQFSRQSIRLLSYSTELETLFGTKEKDTKNALKKFRMPRPLFDTGIRGVADTPENWALLRSPKFARYVHDVFREPEKHFFSQENSAINSTDFDIRLEKQLLTVRFTPIPMQPPVVERARLVAEAEHNGSKLLKAFADEDAKFASELRAIADKKSARLEELRKKSIPPFKDKEFMDLSREYQILVDKRDARLASIVEYAKREKEHFAHNTTLIKEKNEAVQTSTKKIRDYKNLLKQIAANKAPKDSPTLDETEQALEIERQNLEVFRGELASQKLQTTSLEAPSGASKAMREKANDLLTAEALLHLRDAALYGRIRLSLVSEQDLLREERKSIKVRNEQLENFAAVRRFIYAASNETDIPLVRGRRSPLAGGVLAITRSEAEEQMHELDSRPLLGENGLVRELLSENIAGYNMVVVDKTFGLDRIWETTQKLLIFSSIIAFIAILAAWFFSGMAVRRIQSLSRTSGEVKEGKLDVVFNDRGYDELSTLGQSLNAMVGGLKEREELRGELMAAEEIQKRLLPMAVPTNLNKRADIAGFYKAMVGIGGDYFDYVALGKDHVAIAMGDVSSHGVGPALVMAMTRSQLHAELREKEISLSKILLKLNEQLYLETPSHMFVTFFLGLYNLKTGELQYISAGHSKPLFFNSQTKKAKYLEAGGMPLGMDDNDFFESTMELQKVVLKRGDVFLQYTDGLSEAMNSSREQFGYERMEESFVRVTDKNAGEILSSLARDVEKFSGTNLIEPGPSALSDDIALVCLKRV